MTAFVPYVYGAAAGRPSSARPGLVLSAGTAPETPARRFERELDELGNQGKTPAGCGTAGAYRRHLRKEGKPVRCAVCLRAESFRKHPALREAS